MALNHGLKISSNELIGRLDPGDVLINERFHLQKEYMDANLDISICGSFAYEKFKNSKRILKKPELHKFIIKDLIIKNPLIHSSVIFRKKDIKKLVATRLYQNARIIFYGLVLSSRFKIL